MSEQHQGKRVGDLNGLWAMLFRFFLALFPFMLAWAVWVTSSMYELRAFATMGDRYTEKDGLKAKLEILELIGKAVDRLDDRIDGLPPKDFVKRVDAMDGRIELIAKALTDLKIEMATHNDEK